MKEAVMVNKKSSQAWLTHPNKALVALSLIIIFGIGVMVYDMRSSPSENQSISFQNADTATLGAAVTVSGVEINIENITRQDDQEKQSSRVTVSTSLRNISLTPVAVSPGLQFFVTDDVGVVYGFTAEFLSPDIIIGGPLQPKQTETLALDFVMPLSRKPVTLQYQADASTKPTAIPLETN